MHTRVAAAVLAIACAAPILASRHPDRDNAGPALSAYFTACAIVPLFGAYPVPLVGLGMSFPLGWWLGMALLSRSGPGLHD